MNSKFFISQLEKKYNQVLSNYISGLAFEPIILWGGKNKPDTTVQLHESIKHFIRFEKKEGTKGWIIQWEEWSSRKLGTQKWPTRVLVNTIEDYLFLVGKNEEVERIGKKVSVLTQWKPGMAPWLAERPDSILQYWDSWDGICAVVDYFLQNDPSGQYLRSLPVPVHTKFIETHETVILSLLHFFDGDNFPEPLCSLEQAANLKVKPFLFTIRWLDDHAGIANGFPMEVVALAPETLRAMNWQLHEIWLVENETALYMLAKRKNAMAICTRGKAIGLLENIPFFSLGKIIYWGDMDEHGYLMLSQCRRMYPKTVSFCMDHQSFTMNQTKMTTQPAKYATGYINNLAGNEEQAFQALKEINGRIEQEQLTQQYVVEMSEQLG